MTFGFQVIIFATLNCLIEILKLYIATIAELKNEYIREEVGTLDAQFIVADLVARKHLITL